jgi:ABC-type nitrate/sulfonate/bicarbonate transport system permease component
MSKILIRCLFLIGFILVWEMIYLLQLFPELLFPSVRAIFTALIRGIKQEGLLLKTFNTLTLIFQGMSIGVIIAIFLTGETVRESTVKF